MENERSYEMKQRIELIKSEINGYIFKYQMDINSANLSYLFNKIMHENLLSKFLFGKKMIKLKENELLDKIKNKNSINIIKNSFQEYYKLYEEERQGALENWEKENEAYKKEIIELEEKIKELETELEIVERAEKSDALVEFIDFK